MLSQSKNTGTMSTLGSGSSATRLVHEICIHMYHRVAQPTAWYAREPNALAMQARVLWRTFMEYRM